MKATDYAWNKYEQRLFLEQKLTLPSKTKVKIKDLPEKRLELERLLETLPQSELVAWALAVSKDFLVYIDIGADKSQHNIIVEAEKAALRRMRGEISASQCRTAGFLANELSKRSLTDISRYAARVFAHAVATGHMRSHAIIAADYAIRVINLRFPEDPSAVLQERQRQIDLVVSAR